MPCKDTACPYISNIIIQITNTNKYQKNIREVRISFHLIELKGMHLNHHFYVVVGKQCRTKMRRFI